MYSREAGIAYRVVDRRWLMHFRAHGTVRCTLVKAAPHRS